MFVYIPSRTSKQTRTHATSLDLETKMHNRKSRASNNDQIPSPGRGQTLVWSIDKCVNFKPRLLMAPFENEGFCFYVLSASIGTIKNQVIFFCNYGCKLVQGNHFAIDDKPFCHAQGITHLFTDTHY